MTPRPPEPPPERCKHVDRGGVQCRNDVHPVYRNAGCCEDCMALLWDRWDGMDRSVNVQKDVK